jgi:PAS domain S-box-containing protein
MTRPQDSPPAAGRLPSDAAAILMALRASELSYRRLFEAARDGILILEVATGRITDVNPFLTELLGFSHAEMVGQTVGELSPFRDIESNQAMLARLQREGYVRYEDLPLKTRDGRDIAVEFVSNVYRAGDCNVIQCNVRDITARKRTEAALRTSEARLRQIIDLVPVFIFAKDRHGRFLLVNQTLSAAYGLTPAEVEGRTQQELVLNEGESLRFLEADREVIESGRPKFIAQEQFTDAQGQVHVLQTTKVPFAISPTGEPAVLGASVDITERRRMEQALRESEGHFRFLNELTEATRALADPAAIMAVITRMLGGHLHASRCAYAEVERDGEQFTFRHDFADGCASTAGPHLLSRFGPRAVTKLHGGQTLVIRHVDRELLPAEGADMFNSLGIQAAIICPLVKEGVLRALMAVQQTAPRNWQPREISLVQDLVERCWAKIERRTAEETIHRLNTGLERRVTERTAQLEAANHELEAFSYSVSHDLRAPLRHISGFVQLLQEDAGPALSETGHRHLATILASSRRMGVLIDDLLGFSRVGRMALQKAEVDLDALVRLTLDDFAAETQDRSIAWVVHSLPSVRADRALLHLVLVNLVGNAVKFTGRRDAARIEIGHVPAGEGEAVIFIRDNGAGFDPHYAGKLFGVFQRLHHQNEFAGTGIGLANVQRIILRHGGRVWAEGVVDGGATFYFSLPNAPAPAA